ncbi:MAG: hypothetical protein H6581_27350 [Bacteroidia bacterium]|nr:hypothetical protein [Bacteroidia bacterium]
MFAPDLNIANFIVDAFLHDDQSMPVDLRAEIRKFVEKLSIQIEKQSVEEVSESFLGQLFALKSRVILQKIQEEEFQSKGVFQANEPARAYFTRTMDLQLSDASQQTNAIIEMVQLALEKRIGGENLREFLKGFYANATSFQSLSAQSLLPNPVFQTFFDWIRAFLKVELGLIFSGLVLGKGIFIGPERIIQELIPFLNQQIRRFGAYSILLDFWNPDYQADSPQYLIDIKILASTLDFDFERGISSISLNDLSSVLADN